MQARTLKADESGRLSFDSNQLDEVKRILAECKAGDVVEITPDPDQNQQALHSLIGRAASALGLGVDFATGMSDPNVVIRLRDRERETANPPVSELASANGGNRK